MCGILGVLESERIADGVPWYDTELKRFSILLDAMAHRGPDDTGTWIRPGILLGHRRLSILDLSESGRQPMVSPRGTVLTFNGEIYNYLELKKALRLEHSHPSTGDTAVLLAALDEWGLEGALNRVRGMFAFAAWMPDKGELCLARDPVGKKPLFVSQGQGRLIFSSTMAGVLGWRALHRESYELDAVAINHALSSGWVPSPRTGVVGVEKLPPGTYRVFTPETKKSRGARYWNIPFATPGRTLDEDALEEITLRFRTSVQRRLRSDLPIATLLSGGLDSSLVTAVAAQNSDKLVAYTVRTHSGKNDEFDLSRKIAKYLGIEQRILDLDPDSIISIDRLIGFFGEPFCDSSAIPTAQIFQQAGNEHRVVLTGDGGDEVQGGYTGAKLFALRYLLWSHDRDQTAPEVVFGTYWLGNWMTRRSGCTAVCHHPDSGDCAL